MMALHFRCKGKTCNRKFHPVGTRFCSCGAPVPAEYWFVRKIDGKRHVKFFGRGTRTFVEHEHKKWCDELLQGLTAPPPQRLTLQNIADAYVRYLEDSGKRYAYESKLFLDRLIEYVGNITCETLAPRQLQEWQTFLRSKGLSPAYTDRHFQVGKAAWNRSIPDVSNPFRRVKLFKPDNTVIERLTPDEESRLLVAARCLNGKSPRHFYEILLVALNTGLRLRNILQLKRSEVDFDTGTISVTQKRGRTHRVPMNSLVVAALWKIKPPVGSSGYFFPSKTAKGKPLDDVRKSLAEAKRLAGITKPFRFHGLRHAAATKLLKRTKNLALVSRVLGHSDIRVTQKYAHILDEDLREAVDSLVAPDDGLPQKKGPHN